MKTTDNSYKVQMIKNFFKKYTYFFVIGIALCSLILALVLQPSGTTIQVGTEAITFISPISNGIVQKEYSAKKLLRNETLKQWEVHKAIDFFPDGSTEVVVVYDGTVDDVYSNYLEGTVVVIGHKDGLKTFYKSLDKNVKVEKGDILKQGTVIGNASTSMSREASVGIHLHFEVTLNNKLVDPNNYLTLVNK